jgi:CubicO group peptidase (beta-lactamase class C family)
MLLTHSAGAGYDFLHHELGTLTYQLEQANPTKHEGVRRGVAEEFWYPLCFQPGSDWLYGAGLDWAGLAVERATGKTLGEFVEERVSKPLGIGSAEFYPVKREELRERMVDLNPEDTEGVGRAVLAGGGDMNERSNGHHFGGHGLFMAGDDFSKVLRSLLANDGKVLKKETVESMFEDHLTPKAAKGLEKALASPAGTFYRVGMEPGAKAGYGLGGILAMEDSEGWYGAKTMSWGGGLTFAWFIDRKNDLCGVGAMQAKLPVDIPYIAELKQTFRHDAYRKRDAWKEEQQK